jgi:hypothetical protein
VKEGRTLVTRAYNPSYLGDYDWKDHGLRPALKEKFRRSHLNAKKMGMVVHPYHPSNGRKHKIGESQSRPTWVKSNILSSKQTKHKRTQSVAQATKP